MTIVPLDVGAALAARDSADGLAWPLPYSSYHRLGTDLLDRVLLMVRSEPAAEVRNLFLLMAGGLVTYATHVLEAAQTIDAARARGATLVAKDPELRFLMGDAEEAELPAASFHPKSGRTNLAILRQIVRTASWTPFHRLLQTLLWPQARAATHNSLLAETARAAAVRVSFHHAERYLAEARAAASPRPPSIEDTELAGRLADSAIGDAISDCQLAARARRLVVRRATAALAVSAADRASLSNVRKLPSALWIGSLGHYAARQLACEIRRRGGSVTNFDHTTGRGLNIFDNATALTELAFSSRFVTFTPAIATLLRRSDPWRHLPQGDRATIDGGAGDPTIAEVAHVQRRGQSGKPRVTYVSTILRGPRQSLPPQPSDAIYLDWMIWFAAALAKLPIALQCRPHPEGALRGLAHPISAVAPVASQRFEDLLEQSDLLIFDEAVSTTLYEALCTEIPIIFVDFGTPYYDRAARGHLEERCRILKAEMDERNRLRIDPFELRSAVLSPFAPPDPTAWRALFLGSPAAPVPMT